MSRCLVFIFISLVTRTQCARTTYYQSFDQLIRSGGNQGGHRSKSSDADKEKKSRASLQSSLSNQSLNGSQSMHRSRSNELDKEKKSRASLQQSLSSQSFSNASFPQSSKQQTHGSLSGDRKTLGSLGSTKGSHGSIGATSGSLEMASTRGSFPNSSFRGQTGQHQTVIVQAGGGSGFSKLLNSEAAKSAGAAFGTATAALVAKGVENRFSGSHSPPAPAVGPCTGYCR